jgi:hypothetical protein
MIASPLRDGEGTPTRYSDDTLKHELNRNPRVLMGMPRAGMFGSTANQAFGITGGNGNENIRIGSIERRKQRAIGYCE